MKFLWTFCNNCYYLVHEYNFRKYYPMLCKFFMSNEIIFCALITKIKSTFPEGGLKSTKVQNNEFCSTNKFMKSSFKSRYTNFMIMMNYVYILNNRNKNMINMIYTTIIFIYNIFYYFFLRIYVFIFNYITFFRYIFFE